jgi:hypothetical protein
MARGLTVINVGVLYAQLYAGCYRIFLGTERPRRSELTVQRHLPVATVSGRP